jgi:hypothetical protein
MFFVGFGGQRPVQVRQVRIQEEKYLESFWGSGSEPHCGKSPFEAPSPCYEKVDFRTACALGTFICIS